MKKLLTLLALAFYINISAQAPTANFSMPNNVCFNDVPPYYGNQPIVNCIDSSTNNPTSWLWTITPNTNVSPNTSTLQSPTFTFSNTGTFSVKLVVSNTSGTDSITKTINILGPPTVSVIGGIWNFSICGGSGVNIAVSGANTYTWSPATGLNTTNGSSVYSNPTSATNYTILGTNTDGCIGTMTVEVWPNPTPTITVNSATICAGQQTATLSVNGANTYTWTPNIGLSNTTGSSVYANPSSTIVYTVTNTDGGCFSQATSTVLISSSAPPTLTITQSSPILCYGITDTLTAYGAANYFWNNNNYFSNFVEVNGASSYYGIEPPFYTVTGIDSVGCQTTDTVTLHWSSNVGTWYTLNPDTTTPHVWNIIPDATGGTAPYSYNWNWGDGTSDNLTSHTYSVAAYYEVCLNAIDINGCMAAPFCLNDSLYRTSTDNTMIQLNVVNGSSGISEVAANSRQLAVYPNPTSSVIHITGINTKTDVHIFDVLGKEVRHEILDMRQSTPQIDVSLLPSGVYFIKADNETKKFIKQ